MIQDLLNKRNRLFHRFVLIYQMPKIGSQTIEATLRQCSFPHPIQRLHYLSQAMAGTIRHGLSSTQADQTWKRDAEQQLDQTEEICRVIRKRRVLRLRGLNIPKLEVITGVRDLIGLVLASIFENYLYFAPTPERMTTNKCREALLHPKTFNTLRDWFDLELKSFLEIDVYKTNFPHDEGYAIYENRFARVLVYRFEDVDNLPVLLEEFLGCEVPALVNCNLGESKQYAEQYRFVKEHLRLPGDFLASLYACKMMRHFYSTEERQRLLDRWADPRPEAVAAGASEEIREITYAL